MAAVRLLDERLYGRQWTGIFLGLFGVGMVVWHKVDTHALSAGSLVGAMISLVAITTGTLYQRVFCARSDLRSAAFIQFLASFLLMAPLAWRVEGFQVHWASPLLAATAILVIGSSILAVSVLHTLMRRGQATRVTSLLYLTPIIAVVLEWWMFGVVPSALTVLGIAITCVGVALVTWHRR